MPGGGRNGGGVTAKPETTVQDYVSTFVCLKHLNAFNKMQGNYFKYQTKHDLFLNLTK